MFSVAEESTPANQLPLNRIGLFWLLVDALCHNRRLLDPRRIGFGFRGTRFCPIVAFVKEFIVLRIACSECDRGKVGTGGGAGRDRLSRYKGSRFGSQ